LDFVNRRRIVMAPFVRSDADVEGASDFEDHDIPFEEAEFVPPAPPIQMPPLQGAAGIASNEFTLAAGTTHIPSDSGWRADDT
jgi:hypothetical protein